MIIVTNQLHWNSIVDYFDPCNCWVKLKRQAASIVVNGSFGQKFTIITIIMGC